MTEKYPSWLRLAITFEGTKEIPGDKHNAQIVEFLRVVSKGKMLPDETDWCAAAVQYPLFKTGFKIPFTLSAQALKNHPECFRKITKPIPGCIVVMKRKGAKEDWQGHTGFWLKEKDNQDYIYGGNQGNEFNYRWFEKSLVICYLWPVAALSLTEIYGIVQHRKQEYITGKIELPTGAITPNVVIQEIKADKSLRLQKFGWTLWAGVKGIGWLASSAMQFYPATKELGIKLTSVLKKGEKQPENNNLVQTGEQSLIETCIKLIKQLIEKIVTWLKKKGTKV